MPRALLPPRLGPLQRLGEFLFKLIFWPILIFVMLLALLFQEREPGYQPGTTERALQWIASVLGSMFSAALTLLLAYGVYLLLFARSTPSAAPSPATTAVGQQPVTAMASPSPAVADPEPSIVKIDSIPPGATVLVHGKDKGRTPVYFQNTYPSQRPVEVKLYLPGYKVWTGAFIGGSPAELQVTLKRP